MSPAARAFRAELVARREQVAQLAARHNEHRLAELLVQVDAAIDRLETPSWGRCEACADAIESERLCCDPLVTVCLECLSNEQRESLERDLRSAAQVQRALMPPRRLDHGEWQVAWLWEPKGVVSGDWVDLSAAPDGSGPLDLMLGDVVGKGVAASIHQAYLHAMFRALASTTRESPDLPLAELLGRANGLFFTASAVERYATLIAARIEAGGHLEMATAGHPRPLLADRRGVRPIEGSGFPLGLLADAEWTTRRLRLERGDTLLLYSDGFTEATRQDDEELGIGRAAAILRRAAHLEVADLVAACRDSLDSFLAGAPRVDDLTLLALRRG